MDSQLPDDPTDSAALMRTMSECWWSIQVFENRWQDGWLLTYGNRLYIYIEIYYENILRHRILIASPFPNIPFSNK
jgi:hypothetical protein